MKKLVKKKNPVGRPRIGTARSLKITMPPEAWAMIDSLVDRGLASSATEVFRESFYQSQEYFDFVAERKKLLEKKGQLHVWYPGSVSDGGPSGEPSPTDP